MSTAWIALHRVKGVTRLYANSMWPQSFWALFFLTVINFKNIFRKFHFFSVKLQFLHHKYTFPYQFLAWKFCKSQVNSSVFEQLFWKDEIIFSSVLIIYVSAVRNIENRAVGKNKTKRLNIKDCVTTYTGRVTGNLLMSVAQTIIYHANEPLISRARHASTKMSITYQVPSLG